MRRAAPKQQTDEMGFPLCRVPGCGKRIPKGRQSYCSADCADKFTVAYFPSFARRAVFARDHGICAKCGMDTEFLRRILHHVRFVSRVMHGRGNYQTAAEVFRELGFKGSPTSRGAYWQADHIHECVNGGWGKGIENFRTLCTPCHKEETARLARELAERRRQQKQSAIGGVLFV